MDLRLEQALQFSNYKETLELHRTALLKRFAENTIVGYNGGKFTVTKELLNLLEHYDNNIILDSNNIPIMIDDLIDFKEKCKNSYYKALNEYYTEYEKLKKARKISTLTEFVNE